MNDKSNILDLIRQESAQAVRQTRQAVIIQPGAIGDCILTLPLARFLKEALNLGSVDIIGHTDYISFFPGRSCIDAVRSIDLLDLHKLFADPKTFDLPDNDPLIGIFAAYPYVISFLGQPGGSFEQNLLFTAHCSHSADVVTIPVKPPPNCATHVADFYIREFIRQSGLPVSPPEMSPSCALVNPNPSDIDNGKELLRSMNIDPAAAVVVIHPGSGGVAKCWPLSNFLAVAQKLIASHTPVVFILGPAERGRFTKQNLASLKSVAPCLIDISLTDVLQILSVSGAFLGNDSGITHLAGALGVKTIALFSPTDPAIYAPLGGQVSVLKLSGRTFSNTNASVTRKKILNLLSDL